MLKLTHRSNGNIVASACWVTAILNGLSPAGQAQDVGQNRDYWHRYDSTSQDQAPADPWKREPETTLRYGSVDVFPSIRGSLVYDDNIYITEKNTEDDLLWAISPAVLFATGDYRQKEENMAALQYSPTFLFFTDNSDENSVDHDAQGRLQFRPAKWTLQLHQGFQRYSGTVADVGQRAKRSVITTEASARYEISPKTSWEVRANQTIVDYDESASTPSSGYNEWTLAGFVDYWLTPKLRVGPGFTAGWVDVPASANQTYQQFLARATYSVSEKVEVNGTAGVEVREFQGDQDNRVNGVFSLGAAYRPLPDTLVNFEAYRRDDTSIALVNQNYTLTGFSAGVRQTIAVLYSAGLSAGYYNARYHSTVKGVNASREDDHFYVRAEAGWNATGRLTLGAFYQYRNNDSSATGFAFDSNQVGINANYRF